MFHKNRWWISLLAVAIVIKVFSLFPFAVEHYYSQGVYPYISSFQRILFGWIPISIGDLLYGATGIWLIIQAVKLIKKIRNRSAGAAYIKHLLRRLFTAVLIVYTSFNLLWGLNYNRLGIDYQLKLETSDYSNDDLLKVTTMLVHKLNDLEPGSLGNRQQLRVKKYLFNGAVEAYHLAANRLYIKEQLPAYSFPSVKPSIFSYLGNYLGFTGYYNPFTGEAQVNTTVPLFVRPFTTCHEIGHQLGYAKESEANFAGYLSASASTDTAFLFSVYFDMFAYSARYLYYTDSFALKDLKKQLAPGVVRDIRELQNYLRRYSSPLGNAIDELYSQYLKANEQPSGKMSYNEVVAMLIAYYKKFGRI